MINEKRFKCGYCSKKYIKLGKWFEKHLADCHPDKNIIKIKILLKSKN